MMERRRFNNTRKSHGHGKGATEEVPNTVKAQAFNVNNRLNQCPTVKDSEPTTHGIQRGAIPSIGRTE
jgi:hypothetical protein